MEIRINNCPIPEGKTAKKIKLSEALLLFKDKHLCSSRLSDTRTGQEVKPKEFTRPLFEDALLQESGTLQDKRKAYRIQRKCRECERAFSVIKGCRREHARLCQTCTELRNHAHARKTIKPPQHKPQ